MTDDELIARLHDSYDLLPRETVDEIVKRPELVPRLREIVETEPAWDAEEPGGWAPVHATLLLAAMKPEGSLELMVRAMHFAEKHGVRPVLVEMPAILASFGPGAVPALRRIALDESHLRYVRTLANDGLTAIALQDDTARDTVAAHLRSIVNDDDVEREVREDAAISLLNFAEEEDRDALVELVGDIFDEETIDQAIRGTPPWLPEAPRTPLSFYDDEDAERSLRFVEGLDEVRVVDDEYGDELADDDEDEEGTDEEPAPEEDADPDEEE
jgi:hypothetical protein